MKTITMPLEEYNKEIRELESRLVLNSYKKGAKELAEMVRERVIYGRVNSEFKDEELIKIIQTLVIDLKKHTISQSIGRIQKENRIG